MRRFLIFALVTLCLAGTVNADYRVTLKKVVEASYPYVIEIVAPAAIEMAVSDTNGLVAIIHAQGHAVDVSIFPLDETGKPVDAELLALVLPQRGPLAAHANYALGVAFHPKLPLLYVWQDVDAPADNDPGTFEHLLVFRIADGIAALVQACGKGSDYAIGRKLGYIAVDGPATRLYFPNLTGFSEGAPIAGIGYFELGEDGLVLSEGADDAAFKARRKTGFSIAVSIDLAGGFAPINDDIVLFATGSGAAHWDQSEARHRFALVSAWPPARPYRRIAVHPTLPAIYIGSLRTSYVQQLRHAEGYITSNFQFTSMMGNVFGGPAVLAPRNLVAFGGHHNVQLISIDDAGRFLPEVRICSATSKEVTALAYSAKFDKLYVAADKKR